MAPPPGTKQFDRLTISDESYNLWLRLLEVKMYARKADCLEEIIREKFERECAPSVVPTPATVPAVPPKFEALNGLEPRLRALDTTLIRLCGEVRALMDTLAFNEQRFWRRFHGIVGATCGIAVLVFILHVYW